MAILESDMAEERPVRASFYLRSGIDLARQRGIVLLMALIFLLLLTLLASGTVGEALLQQRMASAQRSARQATLAAESALRGAQWRLWRGAATAPLHCGSAPIADCQVFDPARPNALARAFRRQSGWVTEGATEYRGSAGHRDFTTLTDSGLDAPTRRSAVLARNPVYLIEDLGPVEPANAGSAHTPPHAYRITARATGGNPGIVRAMESTFVAGGD
jgi:type IV pilus assembly protein PilX